MDDMFSIPAGRKTIRAGRLCLLMGLTVLLLLSGGARVGAAMAALRALAAGWGWGVAG